MEKFNHEIGDMFHHDGEWYLTCEPQEKGGCAGCGFFEPTKRGAPSHCKAPDKLNCNGRIFKKTDISDHPGDLGGCRTGMMILVFTAICSTALFALIIHIVKSI